MKVGIPSETKTDEYRVAMTPAGVRELTEHGHEVARPGGRRRGQRDSATRSIAAQGATIAPTPTPCSRGAEMVVKVKEPLPPEVARLRPGQILFTYLHLAARPELHARAVRVGRHRIAYETVEDRQGRLPLLAPMC